MNAIVVPGPKTQLFNPHSPDYITLTPLQLAASRGELAQVRSLAQQNQIDLCREPIGFFSWRRNSTLTIQGVHYTRGFNALHLAICAGHLNVVQYLLSVDPTLIHTKDGLGNSVFHLAVQLDDGEITRILREKLETINQSLNTNKQIIVSELKNLAGQSPSQFARNHFLQQSLNSITRTRKNQAVIKNAHVLALLNQLTEQLNQLNQLLHERYLQHNKPKIVDTLHGQIDTILLKLTKQCSIDLGAIASYKKDIANDLPELFGYAPSKKWWIAFMVVLSAIITTLIALTGFGLAAEIAGAGFYAGFSGGAKAVFTGGAIKVTVAGASHQLAASGLATSTALVCVTASALTAPCMHQWLKDRGRKIVKKIETNIEELAQCELTGACKVR